MRKRDQVFYYLLFTVITSIILYLIFREAVDLSDPIYLSYLISRHFIAIIITYIFVMLAGIYWRYRIHGLLVLVGTLGLFLLSYILETIMFFYVNSPNPFYQDISEPIFILSQFAITYAPVGFMLFIIDYYKKDTSFLDYFPVVYYTAMELILHPLGLTINITSLEVNGKQLLYWVYEPQYF